MYACEWAPTEAALYDCQKRQRSQQRREAECGSPNAYFLECFHDTPRVRLPTTAPSTSSHLVWRLNDLVLCAVIRHAEIMRDHRNGSCPVCEIKAKQATA